MMEHLLTFFARSDGRNGRYLLVAGGGVDVVQWLKAHREWLPCVHLKDLAMAGNEPRMSPVLEAT